MVSRAPVSSPTDIICTTIGGKTLCRERGSARDSPSFTLDWTSRTASATSELFTVSATMSSAWRSGTPDRLRTPSVRANRDSADLWNNVPKIGIRSLSRSKNRRPPSVRSQRRDAQTSRMIAPTTNGKNFFTTFEIAMRTRVGSGRVPPRLANRSLKVGTTKTSIAVRMIRTSPKTTVG